MEEGGGGHVVSLLSKQTLNQAMMGTNDVEIDIHG